MKGQWIGWGLVAAAVALTAGVGITAVLNLAPADATLATVVQHIALVALGLGLAGFVATLGTKRLTNSQWSEVISIQYNTIDKFLAPVESPEVRDQMRLMFATRAFTSAPDLFGDNGNDISWVPQIISAVVESQKKS